MELFKLQPHKENIMRNVIVADSQGFCWGVRRALDIIEEADKAYILGDLIHNKQVVEKLAEQNKKIIREVKGNEDAPIYITAHGNEIEKFEQLEKLGSEVIDTTCPLVTVIYKKGVKLEKTGRRIVIIGDRNHIEVKGIASRMQDPIYVNSIEDVENTEFPAKIGIISQSTYSTKKFEKLSSLLQEKVEDVEIRNTICSPTVKRQVAAEELAQKVDLMIVIGGYHSSNTVKLKEVALEYVEAHHIETAEELKNEWFTGKQNIGITAGASTPDWIINEIKDKITSLPA